MLQFHFICVDIQLQLDFISSHRVQHSKLHKNLNLWLKLNPKFLNRIWFSFQDQTAVILEDFFDLIYLSENWS